MRFSEAGTSVPLYEKFGLKLKKRNYEAAYGPFQNGSYRLARSQSDCTAQPPYILSTHVQKHTEVAALGLRGLENLCESCDQTGTKCRQSHHSSLFLRRRRPPLGSDQDSKAKDTVVESLQGAKESAQIRNACRSSTDKSSDLKKSESKEECQSTQSKFSRQPVLRGPSCSRAEKIRKYRQSVPAFVHLPSSDIDLPSAGRSWESLVGGTKGKSSLTKSGPGTMAGSSEVNLFTMQAPLPGIHLGQHRKSSFFQERSKNWHTVEDSSSSPVSTPKLGSIPSGILFSTTTAAEKNFFTLEFLEHGDSITPSSEQSSSSSQKFESTEIIPALKNVVVKELLIGPLEKRGLNMDRVVMFLDGSSTPLPLNAPAHCLGGQKIFVKVKENAEIRKRSIIAATVLAERRPSGIQIPRQLTGLTSRNKGKQAPTPPGSANAISNMAGSGVLGGQQNSDSPSDEIFENGAHSGQPTPNLSLTGTAKLRGGPGRISIFFGKEKAEMLGKLNQFKETGVSAAVDCGLVSLLPALDIPDHWTKIVSNPEGLNRKQSEQQMALWELVSTEQNYIQMLGVLSDVRSYLIKLQNDGFMADVDAGLVFRNIEEVFRANLQYFWMESIQPLLKHSRETGEPFDPILMAKGFTEMDRWFQPYITFCLDHLQMVYYIQKKQKDNELFKEFIGWVQSLESLRRLQLKDILVSPMQRLTKYPLLLKAVHKNTVDMAGREALAAMIEQAEKATNRLNFEFSHKQQYELLQRVMQCIESYDAVEAANEEIDRLVKAHGNYVDLTAPMPYCRHRMMRRLWRRGDMKLRDGYTKTETTCYLFTDMFLVCKSIGRKGDRPRVKIVRPPYHIDRIVVKDLSETVGFGFLYMNEFGVPSAAYAFQTSTSDEALKWLEMFQMAREEYHRCLDADENSVFRKRGAAFELTPSSSSGSIGSLKSNPPHRRISIGSLVDHQTAMSVKKEQTEVETKPVDRSGSLTNGVVSHRKSSSMDSTVAAAAANRSNSDGSEKGRRVSHEDFVAGKVRNRLALSAQDEMCLRDSHSSINLRSATSDMEEVSTRRHSLKPNGSSDSDTMIEKRPRSNSVEILGKFIPARLQRTRSRSRSPSPCRKQKERRQASSKPATASGSLKYPEDRLTASPRLGRKLSAPSKGSMACRSVNTSSETLVPDDLIQVQGSDNLGERSASPSSQKRVPSPIFSFGSFRSKKSSSESEKYSSTTDLTFEEAKRVKKGVPARAASDSPHSQSLDDKENVVLEPEQDQQPPQSNHPTSRRQERRYHTADAIEAFKPKSTTYPTGILKRFSWNISSTVSNIKQKPSSNSMKGTSCTRGPETGWRKNSSSTMSSDSFCSSSGVSSSSSQLCVNEEVVEEEVTPCVMEEETQHPLTGFVNVSTVTVNEQHSEVDEAQKRTLRINLRHQSSLNGSEFSESPSSPPPLPQNPPPVSVLELSSGIPTIETQEPTPLTTPVLTPSSTDIMDFIEADDLDSDISELATPINCEEKPVVSEGEVENLEAEEGICESDAGKKGRKTESRTSDQQKVVGSPNKLKDFNVTSKIPQPSNPTRRIIVTHKELMDLIQKGDLETSDV